MILILLDFVHAYAEILFTFVADFFDFCINYLPDDILGVYAEEEEWGKPVGNDIRTRKVTLLIKKALEMSEGEDLQHLMNCLGNVDMSLADLERTRNIIKDCGALSAIEEMAKECIKKAKDSLSQLPDNKYRELLDELADFLIQRKY